MKTKLYLTSLVITLLLTFSTKAQTVCNGEAIRFRETFGTGNSAASLPAGRTTYTYNGNSDLSDGYYRLSKSSRGRSEWHNSADHTGDANGRMMVINAGYTAGEFYKDTVTNLTPGASYSVSLYIMNVNTLGTCGSSAILPKLQFVVEYLSANNSFQSLTTFTTDFVPQSSNPSWVKITNGFMMPGGITSVRYRIINNSNGGCGNDLAIDDITFSQCASLSSLPVKGLKINSVEETASGARLLFSTESEYNTSMMETQKSTDGINWSTIHQQPAAGNSDRYKTYNSTDSEISAAGVYYRIRQTDIDGTFTYSAVVSFKGGAKNGNAMTAYPNPFSSRLSVNIVATENDSYQITLFSAAGAQIQQIRLASRKGTNMVEFNSSQLQKGMYLITALNSDGSIRYSQKLIKN